MQEIIINPDPLLALPVEVIGKTMVEHFSKCIELAGMLEITDAASYARAAELFNNMGKAITAAEKHTLDLGKPFRDLTARIRKEADSVLDPAESVKKSIGLKMLAYQNQEEAKAKALKAEQDRLALEAKKREEESLKSLEKATTEKGFSVASDKFVKAQEVLSTAKSISIPTVFKAAKGIKNLTKIVIDSFDLKVLDVNYHLLNEKKVRDHIKDGTITQDTAGIKFHEEPDLAATGR